MAGRGWLVGLAVLAVMVAWAGAPVPRAAGEEELARVNQRVITIEKFRSALERVPPNISFLLRSPEGKREFLNSLLNRELLVEQALALGMEKDQELVSRLESIKEDLLISILVEKVVMVGVAVIDQEANDYFSSHQDEFKGQEQIRVRHILVKTEEEARGVAEKLKGGSDFATLAEEVSLDKGSKGGGDLGFISRGATITEFDRAAFELKNPGELSPIVKTSFGYHIIKLEERKAPAVKPFEEVKDELKERMERDKRRETFSKYLQGLKDKATVVIREDVLSKELGREKEEMKPAPKGEEKKE